MDLHTRRHGRVADFDEHAGYGHLVEVSGNAASGAQWWFHCTAVADGSRRIAIDTPVWFRLAPGHLGRFEAVDVVPTADGSAADASNGVATDNG